ncbi:hypothetical protein KIN20_020790 [Parelaphostrongylus tenuis]|uniref:Uncharacterized protein n=1 Tax=Parelaphostrongylus tenuis TaxID=148309 RepID=A0AAD5N6C1_PARTN|nr:hypothetical protein KIN20_020790 [Parelaphostrongylus tenuis]
MTSNDFITYTLFVFALRRRSKNVLVFIRCAGMCPSNEDAIEVRNHAILSVGPPTQLMMGLTLNIDGSLDVRSSMDTNLCVLISEHKVGHVGDRIFN